MQNLVVTRFEHKYLLTQVQAAGAGHIYRGQDSRSYRRKYALSLAAESYAQPEVIRILYYFVGPGYG